jgi:hypothetical protein
MQGLIAAREPTAHLLDLVRCQLEGLQLQGLALVVVRYEQEPIYFGVGRVVADVGLHRERHREIEHRSSAVICCCCLLATHFYVQRLRLLVVHLHGGVCLMVSAAESAELERSREIRSVGWAERERDRLQRSNREVEI